MNNCLWDSFKLDLSDSFRAVSRTRRLMHRWMQTNLQRMTGASSRARVIGACSFIVFKLELRFQWPYPLICERLIESTAAGSVFPSCYMLTLPPPRGAHLVCRKCEITWSQGLSVVCVWFASLWLWGNVVSTIHVYDMSSRLCCVLALCWKDKSTECRYVEWSPKSSEFVCLITPALPNCASSYR